jgi:drug/metabolite transporter (DMT)-like permease
VSVSTTRFYVIGFGALMLFDTWTQVSFKLAANQTGEFTMTLEWLKDAVSSPWIYGAVAGYLGAFVTWMTLLKHAPVGPAFAASHLEVVTVLIISVLYFGEHLAPLQIVGGLCIVLGIVFLSLSETKHPHA